MNTSDPYIDSIQPDGSLPGETWPKAVEVGRDALRPHADVAADRPRAGRVYSLSRLSAPGATWADAEVTEPNDGQKGGAA